MKTAQLCRNLFSLPETFFRQFHFLPTDCPANPTRMLLAVLLYTQFRRKDFYLTVQFR